MVEGEGEAESPYLSEKEREMGVGECDGEGEGGVEVEERWTVLSLFVSCSPTIPLVSLTHYLSVSPAPSSLNPSPPLSLQRCMIVHATSNLLIEGNVAYETRGHCYITEEGSEFNNTFLRNLGMSTRKRE